MRKNGSVGQRWLEIHSAPFMTVTVTVTGMRAIRVDRRACSSRNITNVLTFLSSTSSRFPLSSWLIGLSRHLVVIGTNVIFCRAFPWFLVFHHNECAHPSGALCFELLCCAVVHRAVKKRTKQLYWFSCSNCAAQALLVRTHTQQLENHIPCSNIKSSYFKSSCRGVKCSWALINSSTSNNRQKRVRSIYGILQYLRLRGRLGRTLFASRELEVVHAAGRKKQKKHTH